MTVEERVMEVLKRTFELDSVDAECSQKNCEKWDSMGHLNLVVELEAEFGISFEPEEIGEMVTAQDVSRVINNHIFKEKQL